MRTVEENPVADLIGERGEPESEPPSGALLLQQGDWVR